MEHSQANEVLVKVEGVSKKFCVDLKTSLWYGLKDLFSGIMGQNEEASLRSKEFWALKDINFELRRGECLGLIGHNGAGKSTLLKILNGLINPDQGKVTIRGKVGALIELGAGFNPILSGRENIYINGAVLGFTRQEIDNKLEDIIDFAEIREFIDMPVRNYSSGMKVRLGFAVASQMEPDVLIIDEVLAVGDVSFRMKCYNTIVSLLKSAAVIFVSHSMPQISKICNYAILLEKGKLKVNSPNISNVINDYFFGVKSRHDSNISGSGQARLISKKISAGNLKSDKELRIEKNNPFTIDLKLHVNLEIRQYAVEAVFYDIEMKGLLKVSSIYEGHVFTNDNESSTFKIKLINHFNSGDYLILLHVVEVLDKNKLGAICLRYENAFLLKSYSSQNSFESYIPFYGKSHWNRILTLVLLFNLYFIIQ
ncbi:ABC transporter ATP-binding protein [Flavobacteriaceae bacterium]|nr:ABC transporter ATP-binding protein [Flavobacteriaceae bacterium]